MHRPPAGNPGPNRAGRTCPRTSDSPDPADPHAILIRSASSPSRTLTRFPSTFGLGPANRGRTATDRPNGYGRIMLDIAFIAASLAFFALAAGYASLCERL
ncbi:hypothetical protein MOX02_16470 [Methylobacterium oxalidis]|uniref:Uncharacterized protein n=1 Tax=Methylobacterium oxalidis TaxID=944322 RepID=A0A512J180_9HYPH|nr:hypothetical protein MOX02_16470 [Methylobacterium oxalidis]GJE34315.1 hypothetical protein LDDCCGHA_4526 [Methylobacterium oxalidis]GLS64936.1 hypothetical protein GCM10007888_33170 [Methylobacterium oxalidis]